MAHSAADIAAEVTDDAFLGGRLRLLQPANGFRSGVDAVLLAAAVPAAAGESALDLGTGAGVAALCLARRIGKVNITGIDVQPGLCSLARSNALRNGFDGLVTILEADLRLPSRDLRRIGLVPSSFDHVLANPPFHREGRVRPARDPGKVQSSVLGPDDLERWVRFMVTMARPGASITLIHRADATAELLRVCERRVGALRLLPIHPRNGEPAVRVVISGRAGSRAPLRVLPGFTLHRPDGAFTDAAEAILRHGEPLDVA